ncbi:arsenic resistance protein [Achromobacter sp. F4_2707]|uniref:arsenic resistance protein n=1 Tax=Achromobacter sp. F4_2707 TaxID=3114286 RepID=UPI0039C6E4D6
MTHFTSALRDRLELHQILIYFAAVLLAAAVAVLAPAIAALEQAINPALALMLFVTFLQVPLADLGRAVTHTRFLAALLVSNFLIVPLLVVFLVQFVPADPMIRLGFLLVLLTPCVDYVVTFSHIGRADARLLLASTPLLLIVQILLLPIYLRALLGVEAAAVVQLGPFVHAFVWLIAVPLSSAAVVQQWAQRRKTGARVLGGLSVLPVPATALVLFIVVAAVVPQSGAAIEAAVRVLPLYAVFAAVAPFLGWGVARFVGLPPAAGRAVAFSSATRNSLVVLPLALAVPGGLPVLPAIVVTQTMVELVASVLYMRWIPKLGGSSIPDQ